MGFKETVTLGELSVGGKGSYGIGASAVDFNEKLPTYLRITDISEEGYLLRDTLKSVDDPNAKNYKLKTNDIVFARTGNSTGRSYFYDGSERELIYAGFLIKFSLDEKKVNPKFIRYYTLSDQYRGWVKGFSTGSTRGNINAKSYANMQIDLPTRKYQDFAVNVLSGLENKYKMNISIISNLQKINQMLFKHWFLDFEFPNENEEPYKSSGGEMVESEMGEIPKGWSIEKSGLIANFKNGKKINENDKQKEGENKIFGSNGIIGFTDEVLQKSPSIIIGRVGANCGSLKISLRKCWITDNAIIGTVKDMNYYVFLYLTLSKVGLREKAGGSAQPLINQKILNNISLVLPSKELLEKYHFISYRNLQMIEILEEENEQLTKLRETLLPKLLSGEIELPDEIEVTEHVPIP